MNHIKTSNKKLISITLILFLTLGSLFSIFSANFIMVGTKKNNDFEEESEDNLKTSDSTIINNILDVTSDWWNSTYGYRMGFKVEESDGINNDIDNTYRYEPIDLYFPSFNENEHYKGSTRLVRFNATGSGEWSDPIPIEVWNITDQLSDSNYIQSCTVTFMANVTANDNSTYFLYFNDDLTDIETDPYDTGFTATKVVNRYTITVNPPSGSQSYSVEFEVGSSVDKLQIGTVDYHQDDAFRPEMNEDELKFLVHFDENIGTTSEDSTGINADGRFGIDEDGGTTLGSPSWDSNGVIGSCLYFDRGDQEVITWQGEGGSGGEEGLLFLTRSEEMKNFTISGWIKPDELDSDTTNHGTQNTFLSKASDDHNDNIEMGITMNNELQVYVDSRNGIETALDYTAEWGNSTNNIVTGIWNYFALVWHEDGDTDVYIYNSLQGGAWFLKDTNDADPWMENDASDPWIDTAPGSCFTIGASQHGSSNNNQYYQGWVDEIAIYSTDLDEDEVENYATTAYDSTIETVEELVVGDVMARYRVNWSTTFDMHVSDIMTFYYDYNLYDIERTIWFDSYYGGSDDNSITILNAQYNLLGNIYTRPGAYIGDGSEVGISTSGTSENYTVIIDLDANYDAFGLFTTSYNTEGSVASSCSNLQGSITVTGPSPAYLTYSPGSTNDFQNNNGGEDDFLNIDFWEFADRLTGNLQGDSVLAETARMYYFNNISAALKNPLDTFYIYNSDNRFYNIEVNVTDIDDNPVPNANASLYYNNLTYITSELTDSNGITTFTRLQEDTYQINVTYLETGFDDQTPLTITSPKTIILNDDNVVNNVNKTLFDNVALTTLNVTCWRWADDDWAEPLSGAKVNYSINDGAGDIYIGYINADNDGTAIVRHNNLSQTGKITFNLEWHGDILSPINTTYSIDGRIDQSPGNNINITLSFYQADSVYVNYSSDSTIYTRLQYPIGTQSGILTETLDISVNYSYSDDNMNWENFTSGDNSRVSYEIYIEDTQELVSTGSELLLFDFYVSNPNYTHFISINTSNLIDSGGIAWHSDIYYEMKIVASCPSYPSQTANIRIKLNGLNTQLSAVSTIVSAYWTEELVFSVYYENTYANPDVPITDATVYFEVEQDKSINGTMSQVVGSPGWYSVSLLTTLFPTSGAYGLEVEAWKQDYQVADLDFDISINDISTKINGTFSDEIFQKTVNVYFGDEHIFYFNYTISSSGYGLNNSEVHSCVFKNKGTGEKTTLALTFINNGIYMIDIGTESLSVGEYTLTIKIAKTNYEEATASITLFVNKREFNIITEDFRTIISGSTLIISISLSDYETNMPLNGSTIYTIIDGTRYDFTDNGDGTYESEPLPTPVAFFTAQTQVIDVEIELNNYKSVTKTIIISVGMVEIFPGVPLFWALMVIGAIVAVVGSLGVYRYLQIRNIPKFVKKNKAMRKAIHGKNKISDNLLYPTKAHATVKLLGNKWDEIGLSLRDIFSIPDKKGRNISDIKDKLIDKEGGTS